MYINTYIGMRGDAQAGVQEHIALLAADMLYLALLAADMLY
jgi:hypothetical protein